VSKIKMTGIVPKWSYAGKLFLFDGHSRIKVVMQLICRPKNVISKMVSNSSALFYCCTSADGLNQRRNTDCDSS